MTSKFKKQIIHFFLSLFFLTPIFSVAQIKANDITGLWLTEDKDAHVQIEKKGNAYFGKIVWLKFPNDDDTNTPKLDKKNPNDKLKSRPILGLNILSNFKFDGSKEWKNGKIYDPQTGKTYSCYLAFTDKTKNKLKLRGFIGISLLGGTTHWTRLE